MYDRVCALKTDGTLWCWGDNWAGALGDGTTTQRSTPVQVTALENSVASVKAGYYHTCAVKTDGSLWCWGGNEKGQLGAGDTISRSTPVRIGPAEGWTAVATGAEHTCATRADGSLWCWGEGADGQLGTGDTTRHPEPVRVDL